MQSFATHQILLRSQDQRAARCGRHNSPVRRFRSPTSPRNLPRTQPKRKRFICCALFLIHIFFKTPSYFPRSIFFLPSRVKQEFLFILCFRIIFTCPNSSAIFLSISIFMIHAYSWIPETVSCIQPYSLTINSFLYSELSDFFLFAFSNAVKINNVFISKSFQRLFFIDFMKF